MNIDCSHFTLIKDEIDPIIRIKDSEKRKEQLITTLVDMIKKGYINVTPIAYSLVHKDRELSYVVRVLTIRLRISEAIFRFTTINKDLVDLHKNIEQTYSKDFVEDNKKDGVTAKQVEDMWLRISRTHSIPVFIIIVKKIKELRKREKGVLYA